MKKDRLFAIIYNSLLKSKVIPCLVSFFVLINTINLLNLGFDIGSKIGFVTGVAKVSVAVVEKQVYDILRLPTIVMSKFCSWNKESGIEEVAVVNSGSGSREDKEKGKGSKSNSVEASIGCVVLNDVNSLYKNVNKLIKKRYTCFYGHGYGYYKRYINNARNYINVETIKGIVSLELIIWMLMLFIILARKKVGDDNNTIINKNIKNNNMISLFV